MNENVKNTEGPCDQYAIVTQRCDSAVGRVERALGAGCDEKYRFITNQLPVACTVFKRQWQGVSAKALLLPLNQTAAFTNTTGGNVLPLTNPQFYI